LTVPRIPGVYHLAAVKAFVKAGFRIARQSKHIVMTDGTPDFTIPHHNPVNAFTTGGIVRDAGLTADEFNESAVIHSSDTSIQRTFTLAGSLMAFGRESLAASSSVRWTSTVRPG
jgi:hypothetical protein